MAIRTIPFSGTVEDWKDAHNLLATDVGDLNQLVTTDTSSIVGALNGLDSDVTSLLFDFDVLNTTVANTDSDLRFDLDNIDSDLGDRSILTTADKTSIVAAINELRASLLSSIASLAATAVPVGGVIKWSGAINAIPANWALCDGQNGTPDLRGRFIVGAGSSYSVGATGGAETITLSTAQLPVHSHDAGSLTAASNGAHTHSVSGSTSGVTLQATVAFPRLRGGSGQLIQAVSSNGMGVGISSNISPTVSYDGNSSTGNDGQRVSLDASHGHTFSGTAGSAGAHTHSLTGSTASAGSGSAHENRPPYYALAFIMRVS
jgi:microcystin-dependent protein